MRSPSIKGLTVGIRGKILFIFATSVALVLVAASYGFWQSYLSIRSFDRDVISSQNAAIRVVAMEADFKKQVQEWKDVLIRGRNPDALDRHWTNFQRREAEVYGEGEKLRSTVADRDAAEMLGQFLTAHGNMSAAYRKGLQQFKDSGFDSSAGDKAVAGIDRGPTELLTKAKERLLEQAQTRAEDTTAQAYRVILVTLAVMAAVTMGAALVFWNGLSRGISRPLTSVIAVLEKLAGGNIETSVSGLDRRDEIGSLARSVKIFGEAMIEAENMRRSQEFERLRAEQEKVAALRHMAETVESSTRDAVRHISQRTGAMADAARDMARSSSSVGEDSDSVASASAQVQANAQTVASAAEELSASIGEIARQVSSAQHVTTDAVGAASEAQNTISRLAEAVERIGAVTQLINDIAGQTNLLALNATIEAARAGEAGKGFSVVASEVKTLATQTAKATGEISQQISDIRSTTQDVVRAVGGIVERIRGVEGVSTAVASAIEEQSAATSEIARNVAETSRAADEVASRIARVSSEAKVTGERATVVSDLSLEVAEDIDELREALVRVVRTSTSEVNRREAPRFAIDRDCRISANGETVSARLKDCSVSGLSAAGAFGSLAQGSIVQVEIAGVDMPLKAEVRGVGQNSLHVKLIMERGAAEAWSRDFERLVSGGMALAA